jgi:chorismate mutase
LTKSIANSSSCSTSVLGALSKSVNSSKREVLENAERVNPGPLTDAAIRRLFERIIDEARSAERQAMHLGDVVDKDEKL